MMVFGETSNRPVTFAHAGDGDKIFNTRIAIALFLILAAFALIVIGRIVWRRYKNKWHDALFQIIAVFIDAVIACAAVATILEICDDSIFAFLSPKRSDGFMLRVFDLLWVSGSISLTSFGFYAMLLLLHAATGFPRWLPLPPWNLKN